MGVERLERAIATNENFRFETTLGGSTIRNLLAEAADAGLEVHIWYVGLNSVELHIQRVRDRVEEGGHVIPEQDIRRRFESSPRNLIELLPKLTSLRLFDNSAPLDPETDEVEPRLILSVVEGRITEVARDSDIPDWATPIVSAALQLSTR